MKNRRLTTRKIIQLAALLLSATLALSIVALAMSPVDVGTWLSRPGDALLLTRGINPHPVQLRHPPQQPLSAMAQLGHRLFYDATLSGSGRLSCASCHDPKHAYGPATDQSVVPGGPNMHRAGFRAIPSLRYLYRQPGFSIGPDRSGDNDQPVSLQQQAQRAATRTLALKSAASPQTAAANLVPRGGLFWDGRADTLQQQARGPLFNATEMDAGTPEILAKKIEAGEYADNFRRLFGQQIFEDSRQVVAEALFALARFQIEDSDFHPFSSKFDAWLAGKARFSPAELRGYLAFNDPNRGNCAACHIDRPTRDHLPPLFTDFQYEALGVPRNPAIPANRNPNYYDLGLCGPFRRDMQKQTHYCGMFLTPSLRNVALRRVFFHNGVFHTLDRVLDWYVNRDREPQRFYPRDSDGRVIKYNDLPPQYRGNVDRVDAPFNRHPGDKPALSKTEIQDVIAFLNTLTDTKFGHRGKTAMISLKH